MPRKTSNSASASPKTRKPRAAVEKVFVVDENRLVAGLTQRKVEAAVWRKPKVRLATPADLRDLMGHGVEIETIETGPPTQTRIDDPIPAAATAAQEEEAAA